ncbi:ProP Permeases of the major facilitator superfamily [Candidatus Nanopelagicaceae bacterium]
MRNLKSKFNNPFAEFPREVGVLVFASFFVAVGFGIISPTLPLFARSFGVNHAQVGAILAAFAFARFATGLISGKLVDHFGERLVYSFGIGFVSITSFAAGFAQNYEQLLIFRAVGGFGSSMFSVAAGSILLRAVDDDHRARAQSLYNGSFLVGMMAGPVVGGALSGFSLRAPMIIYGFLLIGASASGAFLLRNSTLAAKPTATQERNTITLRSALALKPYRSALIISFITSWVLFGMSRSILPLFMVEEIKVSPSFMGLGFTISTVINGIFLMKAGKLSDINGRRYSAVIGTSFLTLFILALALTTEPWMFLAASVIVGFGGAFLSTTPSAIVGDVLEGKGGQVIGLFQMAGDAGAMVAPLILGAIADGYGYRPAFLVSAALMLVAVAVSIKLPETRSSHLGQSSK